jgi:hypothetical protein
MVHQIFSVLLMVFAIAVCSPFHAAAQLGSSGHRTSWDAPNLQGVWDFRSLTPMERPTDLATNETFTEEQAVEFSEQEIGRRSRDNDTSGRVVPYNDFWFDEGTTVTTDRTSLVVDPANGRIPEIMPSVARKMSAVARARRGVDPDAPTSGGFVEDLGPGGLRVRCVLGFNSGPPMTPGAYNNNVQLFQTAEHVVILNEMIHDARIVPLDGRPHLPVGIRQWMGDPRGHWEGDTLVVESTNFLRETMFPNSTANMHLIERFTRMDDNTLLYEVTVEDPTTWSRPWTFSVPMKRNSEPMYEYACHEGNYGLYNILAGAVTEETR